MSRLRQSPGDAGILAALRNYCDDNADFATWAEALELHARALTEANDDPIEIGRLHLELGNLLRDQLGRADRALAHYRAAIDFDAALRPAITAARDIYAEAGKWDQVAKLLAREAESMPVGGKRGALLGELAAVYKSRLGYLPAAVDTLREAVGYAGRDLHLLHELATTLLDLADQEPDPQRADASRREAADTLCEMAGAVSADYAFAYIGAALDAAPAHARGLALLEALADRTGRADAVPARWVAALQASPDGPSSRELRLKLARAYRDAGQLHDATACLEPLLARRDADARALLDSYAKPKATPSVPPPVVAPVAAPTPAPAAPSVETLLDAELIDSVSEVIEDVPKERDFASELAALARADSTEAQAASPLDDLALLTRTDTKIDEALELADAPLSETTLVGSGETTLSDGELLPSTEIEEVELLAGPSDVREAAGEIEDESSQVEETTAVAAQTRLEAALAELADSDDGDTRDPNGEVTLPRAVVDIPPEARADVASHDREDLASTPHVPIKMPIAGLDAGESSVATRKSRAPAAPSAPPAPRPAPVDPKQSELARLRGELERKQRVRDRRAAAEIAEQILALEIGDLEAIAALEDHYRSSRDFRRMRDLAQRLSRAIELPLEVRIARLREVATLSETKLADPDGAIGALRALLVLLPHDEEALLKLRTALSRANRWDELAELIEQTLTNLADPSARAAQYRELGALHRDQRNVIDDAIEAYQRARELDPQPADDATLGELLLAAGRYVEAVSVLEAQLARSEDPNARLGLLTQLAELYEYKLGDDARAYEVGQSLLSLAPQDPTALDRLERIDERCARFDRLLNTLETRLSLAAPAARPALFQRMADLAYQRLHDASRAASIYVRALAETPGDLALWTRASEVFERAERASELTDLMWSQATQPGDAALRVALFRQIAERRLAQADRAGAIQAYEQLLTIASDRAILTALIELLRGAGRAQELSERLDQLAGTSDAKQARELRLERATLFAEVLNDVEAAKLELERVLAELSPDHPLTLERLVELARASGDRVRQSRAQERLLDLAASPEAREELAVELSTLYERELNDLDGAIRVLATWIRAESVNPQPYLRSIPLLERAGRRADLVNTLDALSRLAMADDEVGDFLLRSARVAMDLGDHEGAWNRLVPRVVEAHDVAAEALLRELAQVSGRGEQLAELYVGLAQRQTDPQQEKQRWMDASETYEVMVGAHDRALEATLRAFAKDLDNPTLLDEAERLTQLAKAWPRLGQVYDALLRRHESVEGRVRVLMRHAALLEHKAQDLLAAFERVSLAFQLDPTIEETYREAQRLARLTDRVDELLVIHERRAQSGAAALARVEALLEACSIAQHTLGDPPRATGYLARAVAASDKDPGLLDHIETRVAEIDGREPPLDGRGLTHTLAEVYRERAEEVRREEALAARLLSRSSRLFEHSLDDLEAAYRAIERASTISPTDEGILDALQALAGRAGRLDALSTHLGRLSDDAIDSGTASAALRRLGALFEGPLAAPQRAAEVYRQLVVLRPRDLEAFDRLRACLKSAGQYQDLLIAIDRHLALLSSDQERLPLLREAAAAWELGLGNRFEARDAWRKVLALSPDDAEASAAITRLDARPAVDERTLLESDLVVLPEDLRPSEPSPAPTLEPSAAAEGASQAAPESADAEPAAAPGEGRESLDAAEAPSLGTFSESVPPKLGFVDGSPAAEQLLAGESVPPIGPYVAAPISESIIAQADSDAASGAQVELGGDDEAAALSATNLGAAMELAHAAAEFRAEDDDAIAETPDGELEAAAGQDPVPPAALDAATQPSPPPELARDEPHELGATDTALVDDAAPRAAVTDPAPPVLPDADGPSHPAVPEAANGFSAAGAANLDEQAADPAPQPSALLMELASLDARTEAASADEVAELLESGAVELTAAEATELNGDDKTIADLDSLSSMLEQSPVTRAQPRVPTRVPPPPPMRSPSVPPAPPKRTNIPPPPPPSGAPSGPPPPPRRG